MMRKIIYIIGFLCCFSCNNSSPKSDNATMTKEEFKVEESSLRNDADGATDTKIPEVDFSLNYLDTEITEKLQANYEAQLLAVKHPEFAEAIKEQLENSTKFNTALADSIESIKIKDIRFSDMIVSRNDSIFTKKVFYTSLINTKHQQKDSVLVVVKRAFITIDGKPTVNTSFSFERLER